MAPALIRLSIKENYSLQNMQSICLCENDIKKQAIEIQSQILNGKYTNTDKESRLIGSVLGSVIGDALGH